MGWSYKPGGLSWGGLISQVVSHGVVLYGRWSLMGWSYKPGGLSWGGLIRQVVSHGVVL